MHGRESGLVSVHWDAVYITRNISCMSTSHFSSNNSWNAPFINNGRAYIYKPKINIKYWHVKTKSSPNGEELSYNKMLLWWYFKSVTLLYVKLKLVTMHEWLTWNIDSKYAAYKGNSLIYWPIQLKFCRPVAQMFCKTASKARFHRRRCRILIEHMIPGLYNRGGKTL